MQNPSMSSTFMSNLLEANAAVTRGLPGPLGDVPLVFGKNGLVCEASAMLAAFVAHE